MYWIIIASVCTFLFNVLLGSHFNFYPSHDILISIRFPRAIVAFLAGAILSLAGVITQGLFRNVLACPSILGVQASALLFIMIGYSLSLDLLYMGSIPLMAVLGSCFCLCLLLFWVRHSIHSLVLVGVGLNSIFGSIISLLLILNMDRYTFYLKINNWMFGSFENAIWNHIYYAILPIALGLFLSFYLSKQLDLLYLGEETAISLGSNMVRLRILGVITISLLAGSVIFLVGSISFVGLIVPHICRKLWGHHHKSLLIYSIFLGGALTSVVDLTSKLFYPHYIAPGIILGLVGAPFFLWLLYKIRPMAR